MDEASRLALFGPQLITSRLDCGKRDPAEAGTQNRERLLGAGLEPLGGDDEDGRPDAGLSTHQHHLESQRETGHGRAAQGAPAALQEAPDPVDHPDGVFAVTSAVASGGLRPRSDRE